MRKILFLHFFISLSLALFAQNSDNIDYDTSSIIEEMNILLDSSEYYYSKSEFSKSLRTNLTLLEKALASQNPIYINKGYRFLGYDYIIIQDTLKAIESFKNAKRYAEILEDNITLGNAYMDIANLNSINENFEEAYSNHEKSIELFEKAQDTVLIVKAIYNSYISAFSDNNLDKIRRYLIKAKKAEYEPYMDDKLVTGFKLYWADYYEKKDRLSIAIKYTEEAIDLAKENQHNIELADGYELLSNIYNKKDRYKEAYEYRILYEEINTEINKKKQDAASQLIEAQFSLDYYQKETNDAREKSMLQEEIASKNTLFNYFLLGICFVSFLFLFVLYRANRRRKKLNAALATKNKAYLEAKEKSEHLSNVKTKFFSTVSHELRTPLYGVIGLSSILLEDENLKEYNKDLTSLKFSADYLLALINDVLQLNKIDSNTTQNEIKTFDIRELINNLVSSFQYIKAQNNNSTLIDIDNTIPKLIDGNSVRLSQILMNLIGNACKFTENGRIKISLIAEKIIDNNISIKFVIKDTGIGISKEKQATIFDEFTQAGTIDYNYQGTGLGLPIVKKLITLSNSNIDLKSNLGEGSTFTFSLDFTISKQTSVVTKKVIVDTSVLENKKILVAEDNRINQIVTKKILEKMGVLCTIANNGKEAVQLATKEYFDLVLMDLNMPIMDGFDATIGIKRIDNNIPVIALTAVEVEEVRAKIKDVGMSDIIVKPYNTNRFTQIILENINS